MTVTDVLHWVGASALVVYGLVSATAPRWMAGALEHNLLSGRGVSEFRVANGSVIGPALFALVVNQPVVFQLLGWGWIGAAVVRVVAYLPDRPKLTLTYVVFFVVEVVLGLFLLL